MLTKREIFYLNAVNIIGFLVVLIVLTSCGQLEKAKEPKITWVPAADVLNDKANYYLQNAKLDHVGWIDETKCDGLLFNALYAISGGSSDPMLARDEDGKWHRHPDMDCYPEGSKSSISRDMFLGLFLWVWVNKRLDVIEDIVTYGEGHTDLVGNWVMGEGDVFRTTFTPGMKALAYEIRERLGGASSSYWKYVPEVNLEQDDFEAHLQVLKIYMIHLMRGRISQGAYDLLESYAKQQPLNAFFQAVYHIYKDGDQNDTVKLLLDERFFPRKHMPNENDRCEFYLWQRDMPYRACPSANPKKFSGVDYLFVKAIVLGEIK